MSLKNYNIYFYVNENKREEGIDIYAQLNLLAQDKENHLRREMKNIWKNLHSIKTN